MLANFQLAKPKERFWGIGFALIIGFSFAGGLLPTLHTLFESLPLKQLSPLLQKYFEMSFFGIAGALFYLTLPRGLRHTPTAITKALWLTFPLPILIALIFGLIRYFLFKVNSPRPGLDLAWFVFFIPLGEEFLFRGWLYGICKVLFGEKYFTLTNPLPLTVWLTAIAFAFWHCQNYGESSLNLVLFQIVYTFYTGLWLGYLRWKSGNLGLAMLAHLSLNLAALLPSLLC